MGMTYGGQGQPMDLDKMWAQGLCFQCHKKGHLSRDCPDKKVQVHAVDMEPMTESKVEEVKDKAEE